MYQITKLLNGKWHVECMIQDGWERWDENSREEATHSLIRNAKVLNGSYIREDDIVFIVEVKKTPTRSVSGRVISLDQENLLDGIERGDFKVFDSDHYLVKYRITQEEADMIIAIREGRLKTF